MKKSQQAVNDDHRDDHVDDEIFEHLNISNKNSFFLFAGAGSGKTESLKKVLLKLKEEYAEDLQSNGRKIAVITYTNAAVNEIKSRVGYDALFSISTIHSFVWDLISPHQADIKDFINASLIDDITDLKNQQLTVKTGLKKALNLAKTIDSKSSRLEHIKSIKHFTYNPNGDNRDRDSLNHSEVIKIGVHLINNKQLMRSILIHNYPILLIDESQDTNKDLMEAFLRIQAEHKELFALGLFGDTMQRIYNDGKIDLGVSLPPDWKKPAKIMNHRCPKRIVKLINRIRLYIDAQQQLHRDDSDEGVVRLFLCSSRDNKDLTEKSIAQKMAVETGDTEWSASEIGYKQLTIEHHMAARRLGFFELFESLSSVKSMYTSLLDGTLPEMRFFTQLILPIVDAHFNNDKFRIASVIRKHSPLLVINPEAQNQFEKIRTAKKAVDELLLLWDMDNVPTCLDILHSVSKTKLFKIPDNLYAIATRTDDEQASVMNETPADEDDENNEIKKIDAWEKALNSSFDQIILYYSYINGKSRFATHQGVKGLEFPRVMVIIDDDESKGFLFSYDKIFGAKEKTATDLKNENEGKDTSINRTVRLFYVTCSRAEKSLAIVYYTTNSELVKKHVLQEEWFDENEIVIL